MKYKNIVFFSPSKITGGAEYYFIRMAEYLAKIHNEYQIYYTEYENGFAKKIITNPRINFLDFDDGKKTIIPGDSIICISLNFLIKMENIASFNRKNSVIMMWFMHFRHLLCNFTFDNYYKVGTKTRMKVGQHLEKLSDLGVLKFLGNGAYFKMSQQFLFPYHPIDALPIPISSEKYGIDIPVTREIGDVISFCWLGRLDTEKSRNVITYMNELEQIHKRHKVSMSIIGIGPAEDYLKKKAKYYSFPIEFVGEKREDDLDSYIRKNVDIGLASGTSSLEFGLRKVPVIQDWLLDKEYQAEARDSYHLVGNTSLIIDNNTNDLRYEGQGIFSDKLDDVLKDYHASCDRIFQYVLSRSTKVCGEKLFVALKKVENVDLESCYSHIDSLNKLSVHARNSWMDKIHLRRIFVPICKLLSVKPATI